MSRAAETILVVDDEPSFVDALAVGLRREGFVVVIARNGEEALEQFQRCRPDLVLLDVMLPRIPGIEVCRRIRLTSMTPIVMVSARTSEIDAVVGLEVGADDYVTKPYRLRELVARIRAVLRRVPTRDAEEHVEVIEVGDVRLDPASHVVHVRGEEAAFPLKEFELLEALLSEAGRVLTREQLIDRIWGPNYSGDTKTLDVHVKRIRARIETDPSHPIRLVTVRGVGYKYVRIASTGNASVGGVYGFAS